MTATISATAAELIFEVLNFGLLAAGLAWLLFKPVRKALAEENRKHAEREQALDAREAEVEQGQAAMRARQATQDSELQAQATRIVDAAREEAARARAASQAEVQARRDAWETEQAARQAQAARSSATAAAQVVADAVRRLLSTARGPDLDLALARVALDALPDDIAGTVRVELASPPSPELQALLEQTLPAGFQQVVRPELAAGLRVATDGGLVDASAMGLASEAAEAVASGLAHPPEQGRD